MLTYTYSTKLSTRPSRPHPNSTRRRASFARQAAIAAFGPRAAHTLDEPVVEDHQPDHGPRPLGRVAAKVTNNTGVHALRHWLNQAGRADSDEKREVALETAGEIARLLGLDTDLIGPRAV